MIEFLARKKSSRLRGKLRQDGQRFISPTIFIVVWSCLALVKPEGNHAPTSATSGSLPGIGS